MSLSDIKFRGKPLDNGEWVYGSYLNLNGRSYIYEGDCGDLHDVDFGYAFDEVSDKSAGQFTGLKDANGADIYTGDVVEFTAWWFDGDAAESQLAGVIVYSPDNMSFQLKGVKNKEWEQHTGYENDCDYYTPFSDLNFEEADFYVKGNIHDNPELLGGE